MPTAIRCAPSSDCIAVNSAEATSVRYFSLSQAVWSNWREKLRFYSGMMREIMLGKFLNVSGIWLTVAGCQVFCVRQGSPVIQDHSCCPQTRSARIRPRTWTASVSPLPYKIRLPYLRKWWCFSRGWNVWRMFGCKYIVLTLLLRVKCVPDGYEVGKC